jgi:hypothetical protein
MSSIIKVNTVQDQDGNNIINENANTITIGASGDTITIPSGATLANNGTATGFFEGIAWQSVVTASTLTTVAGRGYPINTTSNACTVTLPSSASAGDQVQIVDYAGTFATNNITLTSSLNIEGGTANKKLTTNREGVIITYVDVTQGWVATTGINSGDQALDPIVYSADFLVVAGGGGAEQGGGGGGGYRTSTQNLATSAVYTITVGDGGPEKANGSNSSISGSGITTITSAGGGGGRGSATAGNAGGSGGGAGEDGNGAQGGAGNTPATNPSQGNNGGNGDPSGGYKAAAGGGGAGAVGGIPAGYAGGNGGNGSASSITGSSVTYAGGGGGGCNIPSGTGTGGTGGTGGGGAGSSTEAGHGSPGTANLGGGAGGSEPEATGDHASGGKGIVILSVPDANYSGTTTGSPTVATGVSGKTVLTFNGDGSYTA